MWNKSHTMPIQAHVYDTKASYKMFYIRAWLDNKGEQDLFLTELFICKKI